MTMDSILINQAFSAVKLGNPFLDAILLVLATKLASMLWAKYGHYGNTIWNKFLRSEVEIVCYQIFYNEGGSHFNEVFMAILWVFSKTDIPEREVASIAKRAKNTVAYYCKKDVWYDITISNLPVRIMFYLDTNRSPKFYFRHRTDNTTFRNAISCLLEEFAEYKKSEQWECKVYTWNNTNWSGNVVHRQLNRDDLFLATAKKDVIFNDLDRFMGLEKTYEKRKINWMRGYFLYGLPGSGKSTVVNAISNETKMNVYQVDISSFENTQKMNEAFGQIPPKSIILMEDVDTCQALHRRANETATKSPNNDITLGTVLNLLDGVQSIHGRILIMTSNHKEVLDPALFRAGRVDDGKPHHPGGRKAQ